MEGGGTSWIGRGHVCQGSGKGQGEPLGTRLVGEFAPELSACTGLPRRASEAPNRCPQATEGEADLWEPRKSLLGH